MANQEHLDILAKGVEAWNAWFSSAALPVDLREADLRGMTLQGIRLVSAWLDGANVEKADLRNADLRSASLSSANAHGAIFNGTMMTHARLENADLSDAELYLSNLSDADLSGADLGNAGLIQTNLDRADLRRARLTATRLNGAILTRANLHGAIGLESCVHIGHVPIDWYTYAFSGGLPSCFLRGCGVPDIVIEYLPSLVIDPLQFYSVFISYSSMDVEFAARLHRDLRAQGVTCWFAPHDIQGGRKLHEQIDEAIRLCDKLLLVLSDASMNSPWVKTEIANARARAREDQVKRQMLFPISLVQFERIKDWKLFDPDRGIDSAREIREYFIPDFSNWKDHDLYQKTFERLLRDLKAESGAKADSQPAP